MPVIEKIKLDKIINNLKKHQILLVCDNEKCPHYKVVEREDYDPPKAVIRADMCNWCYEKSGADSESFVDYLDKNFKVIVP